jgi:hypothetical protein
MARPKTVEKVAVTINMEALAWAKRRAKRLKRSLSSVVTEALLREREYEARTRLLSRLGGTDDITPEEGDAAWREWQGESASAARRSIPEP